MFSFVNKQDFCDNVIDPLSFSEGNLKPVNVYIKIIIFVVIWIRVLTYEKICPNWQSQELIVIKWLVNVSVRRYENIRKEMILQSF